MDLYREIAELCHCHVSGVSTAAATTSLTAANYPFLTSRTNASNRIYEGDELYLALTQPSTTTTGALTTTSTSISVSDGSSWPSGSTTPFEVAIDSEWILVTRSSNTLTVLSNGRGWRETRPAAHISGATIYGPATAYNPEQIAAYVASTGVFTPGAAWTIDPGETIPFEIFTRGVSIWDIRLALNRAIRALRYESFFPLTLVTDGDMRNAGTGDWTAGGSPTISKVTNSNAIRGTQSLRVLATVANDYAQSATIFVDPTYSPNWYVQAMLRADVGTATLRAYDVTNSAAISGAETWSLRGWGILDFTFTLPATCEALAFQLESDTSTSDVYWAYLMAFPTGSRELVLPSWFDKETQLLDVMEDRSADRWDNPRWFPHSGFSVIADIANPNNQFRLQLDEPTRARPLWLRATRPADLLVADAQTTYVQRDVLVAAATVELCQIMVARPSSDEGLAWRRMLKDMQKAYAFQTWDNGSRAQVVAAYR